MEQFVFTSALGADPASPVLFLRARGETERYLRENGMTYTILAPNILNGSLGGGWWWGWSRWKGGR